MMSSLKDMLLETELLGDFWGEETAKGLKKLYPVTASQIYIKMGNMEKAKEILIPLAEKFSEKCMHISEASCYKRLDMEKEYHSALGKHRIQYDMKFKKA